MNSGFDLERLDLTDYLHNRTEYDAIDAAVGLLPHGMEYTSSSSSITVISDTI